MLRLEDLSEIPTPTNRSLSSMHFFNQFSVLVFWWCLSCISFCLYICLYIYISIYIDIYFFIHIHWSLSHTVTSFLSVILLYLSPVVQQEVFLSQRSAAISLAFSISKRQHSITAPYQRDWSWLMLTESWPHNLYQWAPTKLLTDLISTKQVYSSGKWEDCMNTYIHWLVLAKGNILWELEPYTITHPCFAKHFP